jgi:hypothetical protein
MPISDLDVYRAANSLIREYGGDAEGVAVQRVHRMLDRRDQGGAVVWLRIRRAIITLEAPQSGPTH